MLIFSREVVAKRRERLKLGLDSVLSELEAVLFFCGEPLTKPGGLDQTYGFLPHPDYYWISGSRRPSGAVLYSLKTGWIDFAKPVSSAEVIWEGTTETVPSDFRDISELGNFLKVENFKSLFIFGEDQELARNLKTSVDSEKWMTVRTLIHQTRRIKDSAEVELIRRGAAIANKGYQRIEGFLRAGLSERDIQFEYEAEVQRLGSEGMPYETIVGTGNRAAVLHAIPTTRRVQNGEMVLIDAGAQISDYCVDITRVFPVSGAFSVQQQSLYSIVLAAQEKAIQTATAGTEWRKVHLESARVIADGLKSLNILKGNTESILESGAISTFYPHGVGHLVGLRVRDTGCLENLIPKKVCGVTLRVDMKIQAGHILTAEPGCYFISALLESSDVREKYGEFINWTEVEKWMSLGGVRIEDDLLITEGLPENLTAVVKK